MQRLGWLVLLSLLAASGSAPAQQPTGAEPVVMRLGYGTYDGTDGSSDGTGYGTYDGTTSDKIEERLRWLRDVLRKTSELTAGRDSPLAEPIAFSVHLGNPYQVYAWLQRRHIDAAIVEPFAHVLLGPAEYTPLAVVAHRPDQAGAHRVRVRVIDPDGRELPHPLRKLHETFDLVLECADREEPPSDDACLDVDLAEPCLEARKRSLRAYSHLSSGSFVPAFIAATRWLDERGVEDPNRRAKFLRQLADLFEFKVVPKNRKAPQDGMAFVFSYDSKAESPLEDLLEDFSVPDHVLVVRKAWVSEFVRLRGRKEGGTEKERETELAGVFQVAGRPQETLADASQREEPRSNFVAIDEQREERRHKAFEAHVGRLMQEPFFDAWFRDGRYEFKISDIVELLRQDQRNSRDPNFALVLPGGGVKAAYQARVLDHLYDAYLVNANEKFAHGEKWLGVRRVIGTSGGAITGVFAALRPRRPNATGDTGSAGSWPSDPYSLTRLWKSEVSESKIFSRLEAPRWAGVIATLSVFALIVVLAGRPLRLPTSSAPEGHDSDPGLLVGFGILILAFPPIVRWLDADPSSGQFGRELWPDAALFAWLVLLSYGVMSTVRQQSSPGSGRSSASLPRWVVLLASGTTVGIAALAPLAEGPVSWGGLAVEVAIVAVAILLAWWRVRAARCVVHDPRRFLTAAGVALAVVAMVHVGLAALGAVLERFSLLELTGVYWLGLAVLAVVFSLLCLGLGRRGWFERGISYLCESHAHRLWHGRRVVALAALGITGFLYWNFWMSPGLYGTLRPHEALRTNLEAFGEEGEGRRESLPLKADLILTAASLDAVEDFSPGDLYFCIASPGGCSIPLRSEWKAKRWLVRDPERKTLMDLIVASGAAFPVFAPRRVDLPKQGSAGETETHYLIDGGYGHNVPVEAAELAGSRQVLIVHSSPRVDQMDPGSAPVPLSGQLVDYLQRIPGFLLERSQQVDVHAQGRMVVASLAPSGPIGAFPFLADFRRPTIRRLLCHAERDLLLSKRIGRVESWGLPGRPRFYIDAARD